MVYTDIYGLIQKMDEDLQKYGKLGNTRFGNVIFLRNEIYTIDSDYSFFIENDNFNLYDANYASSYLFSKNPWFYAETDEVKSCKAYRKPLKQLPKIAKELNINTNSRTCYLPIATKVDFKKQPCLTGLYFYAEKGKVHMVAYIRSLDIIGKAQYDIYNLIEILKKVGNLVCYKTGNITLKIENMHKYL